MSQDQTGAYESLCRASWGQVYVAHYAGDDGRCRRCGADVAVPTARSAGEPDPFRLAEWQALPEVCLIAGCDGNEIDQRGPVWLRDGSMHKACVEHWEPIFRVLGEQATWEQDAGYG